MSRKQRNNMGGKPKFPNNLYKLMQRDNVTSTQIAQAWGVALGDASQRINGKVSITPKRRELLTQKFGWTATEIYDEVGTPHAPELRESEVALMDCIKLIFSVMVNYKIVDKAGLTQALSYQYEEYRHQNMPRAMEVMQALQAYVGEKPHRSEKEIIDRLLHMPPGGLA